MRALPALVFCTAALFSQSTDFDILITGGKVVDGTGAGWFHADIGIRGDSIAAIGRLDQRTAKLRIDAASLIVAPGFIDIHTHSRRGIIDRPAAENYIRQ